jgi:hypothetical protein
MNRITFALPRANDRDLERVIEPLASYICASERPKSALASALTVLCREVEATNRVAAGHFRTFLGNN